MDPNDKRRLRAAALRAGRPLLLTALLLVGVLAAAVAAFWIWRVAIAERLALAWLEGAGLGPATVEVKRVDFAGVHLEAFTLGDPETGFGRAEIEYSVSGLRRGRVERIVINDLRLRVRVDDRGIHVPALAPLLSGTGGGMGRTPVPPFERLILNGFRVTIAAPAGAYLVSGEAMLSAATAATADVALLARVDGPGSVGRVMLRATAAGLASARTEMTGRFAAAGTVGDLSAAGDGEFSAAVEPDGRLAAEVRLAEATLVGPAITASIGSGEARLTAVDGVIRELQARLEIGQGGLPGVQVSGGELSVDYGPDTLRAAGSLAWRGGEAEVEIVPAGSDRYAVSGATTLDAAWVLGRLPGGIAAAGTIAADLRGQMPHPDALSGEGALDALLRSADLTAELRLALRDVVLPGVLTARAVDAPVQLEMADGRLRAVVGAGLDMSGLLLADEIRTSPLDGPLELRPGSEDNPLTIALRPVAEGWRWAVEFDLSGDTPSGGFGASGTAAGLGPGVFAPEIVLNAEGLRTHGLRIGGSAVVRDGLSVPGRLRADLDLRSTLGGRVAGVGLRDAQIAAAGRLRLEDDRLAFEPAQPVRIAAVDLAFGSLRLPGRTVLAVGTEEGAPITYDLSTGAMDAALSAPRMGGELAIGTGADALPVRLDLTRLRLRLAGGETNIAAHGDIGLPGQDLVLRGVDARLASAAGRQSLRLDAQTVRYGKEPAPVVPLRLSLSAEASSEQARFTGELFDPGRRLVLEISGRHGIASAIGEARLVLQPVTFLPTVLQPAMLFPVLGGIFTEVDGRLAGTGRLAWDSGGLRSSARLSADATTLAFAGAELLDAATVLEFDSLAPPSTRPGQELVFGRLNIGLPFTSGRVIGELQRSGRISARVTDLSLFGGSISTEAFDIDPRRLDARLVLRVAGVDLEQFLAFAEYGELAATGTLRGTLPVVISGGSVSIRNGVLETEQPGQLSYKPKDVGEVLEGAAEGTQLLIQAVRDFRYDKIRIEIDERPAEGMRLGLRLEGYSPNVYSGVPIQLNVNVGGELRDLLEQSLKSYQLPEGIANRLKEIRR